MLPKYQEFYIDVLEVLSSGAILSINDIVDFVVKKRNISDEAQNIRNNNGGSKLKNRLEWAKLYLKAAGLIEYPQRGKCKITVTGLEVVKDKGATIDNNYLLRFDSFQDFRRKNRKSTDIADDKLASVPEREEFATPQEQIDSAFAEINAVLKSEILDEIMAQPPTFFEKLVVKLLVKMGYGGLLDGEGIVTQSTNDEGIDGIIREDKLGFSNIYIQAKRYALDKSIGRPDVQGFVGAVATKEGKRLFITTANFTSTAKEYAKANHVVLVDGDKLAELMIEYGVGVSTTQIYEIKRLDSDFFAE